MKSSGGGAIMIFSVICWFVIGSAVIRRRWPDWEKKIKKFMKTGVRTQKPGNLTQRAQRTQRVRSRPTGKDQFIRVNPGKSDLKKFKNHENRSQEPRTRGQKAKVRSARRRARWENRSWIRLGCASAFAKSIGARVRGRTGNRIKVN
jgi:hypothetical protein